MKGKRGGTQVLVALLAPVLVGFTALTVDVGRLYVRKQALSNGVDAATLAGGRELPHKDAADREVRRVAAANHIDVDKVSTQFEHRSEPGGDGAVRVQDAQAGGDAYNYLRVTATEPVPMTFARIFGIQEWPVGAHAAVAVSGEQETVNTVPSGSVPIAIDKKALPLSADGKLSVIISACAFQQFWITPFGDQADAVKDMMINGNPNSVSVGDLLGLARPNDPNFWRTVIDMVDQRIARANQSPIYSGQTPDTATASNPRVVIFPLVDPKSTQADQKDATQAQVVGFAAMYLFGYHVEQPPNSGKIYYLDGKLVDVVTPDAAHDPNLPNPEKGVTLRLSKSGGELDPLKLRLVE